SRSSKALIERSVRYVKSRGRGCAFKPALTSFKFFWSNCELPLTTTTLRSPGESRMAASSVFAASKVNQDPVKREDSLGFPACTGALPQNTTGTPGRNV